MMSVIIALDSAKIQPEHIQDKDKTLPAIAPGDKRRLFLGPKPLKALLECGEQSGEEIKPNQRIANSDFQEAIYT